MDRIGRFWRAVPPRAFRALLARTGGLHYLPRWLLFGLTVGPVVGLAALAARKLAELAAAGLVGGFGGPWRTGPSGAAGLRSDLEPERAWMVPVVVAGGALLAGLTAARVPPGPALGGLDAAVHAANSSPAGIGMPGPVTRAGAAVVTVGSGGSGGLVGPVGHAGAAVGSAVARAFGLRSADARTAVAAGLAAAVGSIIMAPLAGAVFAAELLVLRGMASSALPPALLCSIVAFGVSAAADGGIPVLGEQLSAGRFAVGPDRPLEYGLMIVVGVVAGAAGKAYAVLLHATSGWFSRRRAAPPVKLTVAGLTVGTAGLLVPGVAGAGYPAAGQLADPAHLVGESLWVVLLTPLVKIFCTCLTLGSGAPAGAFGPGLVIGASAGAACWRLGALFDVAPDSPAIFIVAGAVAGIGSVSHTPVAGVVLAAEITGGVGCIPAVALTMVAAVVVVGDTTLFRSQLTGPGRTPRS